MRFSLKITVLAFLLCGLLLFCACGRRAGVDVPMYDFVYPSGYSLDAYTLDTEAPVEGAPWRLAWAENEAPQLRDAAGELLYSLADLQPAEGLSKDTLTLRGEVAARGVIIAHSGIIMPYDEETGAGAVWLCSQAWAESRYKGYVDGDLRGGRLLLLDVASGKTLFSADTQPDELFLTASGSRCYFYHPGKTSRRKDESCPARIYWRDINFWLLPHTVCSFDYVGAPLVDGQMVERLRFYPQPEVLRVDFTCYEQTNVENDRWDFVVKKSVEIPLLEQPDQTEPNRRNRRNKQITPGSL